MRERRLWATSDGRADGTPLLIMGANASSATWPDELMTALGERHRVLRYDHRDTGRSTWAFDERPYAILSAPVVAPLAAAILDHTAAVDQATT